MIWIRPSRLSGLGFECKNGVQVRSRRYPIGGVC